MCTGTLMPSAPLGDKGRENINSHSLCVVQKTAVLTIFNTMIKITDIQITGGFVFCVFFPTKMLSFMRS